jgi:broad specificity phosphatase PhoE
MSKVVIAVAPTLIVLLGAPSARAQKAVYLVRHADIPQGEDDPSLTGAGKDRSQALSRLLKNANIKAIYTSDARRTRQTAQPLADALGVKPTVIPNGDPAATVAKIQADHTDVVVLVVGHSNTVPNMIRRWAPGASPTINPDEFDKIFVVIPEGSGRASFAQFRYGTKD